MRPFLVFTLIHNPVNCPENKSNRDHWQSFKWEIHNANQLFRECGVAEGFASRAI